uniref:Uncharacterized protein LOC111107257 isoform X3 n=1 Tax=Crassostrea virginica TaxID=6565 RepID=A0A8B8B3T2_CRAVI|nr:uncharacterized protein LOC111107257 isoform X3 [Crassostrea virginica]
MYSKAFRDLYIFKNIDKLAKIGVTVLSDTLHKKLANWQEYLDRELLQIKENWSQGGSLKFQIVGDNWDKNILPSYRTSQQNTLSLHLFTLIGVVDRVTPSIDHAHDDNLLNVQDMEAEKFIPSLQEQDILSKELTFLVSTALVQNIPQLMSCLGSIYPEHFDHKHSDLAGARTRQFCLGLYDCNEQKTQDVIHLLKDLSNKYVPLVDGEIKEEVFFGGDRLTDERIQCAQQAMVNSPTSIEKLEGFISKIEDFHRLMNFLEAICKLTFDTGSAKDRCTAYFFRNLLNARDVKADVKNSYRAYKKLYYTIFDGICCALFLQEMNLNSLEQQLPIPCNWETLENDEKIKWLDDISCKIVRNWFFENSDICQEMREVLTDPNHEENYWTGNYINGKFRCHFCDRSYTYIGSLQSHELKLHSHSPSPSKCSPKSKDASGDELYNYILCLFKLTALHKNLDSAVNMGDGLRSVRSAKYETPIYNKTNKTKYLIGSVHLTALACGSLPREQTERLVWNRSINISGGKNHNMALDEFVELVNRDTKATCSGYQTKDSILTHSREFPHLINATKHFDKICEVRKRKGFHKEPSYLEDVKKVSAELLQIKALQQIEGRKLECKNIVSERNPFDSCYKNLATMIHRHKPILPFRRLGNKQM